MSAMPGEWLPWVETLGWTLLHFLWQAAAVGAGFGIVRRLLPRRACDARYAAGLVALLLMAACPVFTFVMLSPEPAGAVAASAADTTLPFVSAPDAGVPDLIEAIDRMVPWIVLLWSIGVLLMLSRAWRQWRALQHVVRRFAVADVRIEAMLAELSRRFAFVRTIRVLVSERIDTPTLIGWLKPVILLPVSVVLGFPQQQIELILAHELGHLRRYDHIVNLAQALLETLFFYHPAVHWVSREVRNEREICCDGLVLRLTAGDPREYARTLAALEDLRQLPAQLALAASGGVLVDRVRRIVDIPAPASVEKRSGASPWLLAVTSAIIVLGAIVRFEQADGIRVQGLDSPMRGVPSLSLVTLADSAARVAFTRIEHVPLAAAPIRTARPAISAGALPGTSARSASAPAKLAAAEPDRMKPEIAPIASISPARPADLRAEFMRSSTLGRVGDVATAKPAPLAAVEVRAEAARPVTTHMVSPQYPATFRAEQVERIDMQFAIAADGSVRDVVVVGAEKDNAFTRAAERAMRQWRFDPRSVSNDRALVYKQSFVFARPASHAADAAADDHDCTTWTGSHICRRAADGPVNGTTMVDAGTGARQMKIPVDAARAATSD
jgi:bla regulator protein BlaR1